MRRIPYRSVRLFVSNWQFVAKSDRATTSEWLRYLSAANSRVDVPLDRLSYNGLPAHAQPRRWREPLNLIEWHQTQRGVQNRSFARNAPKVQSELTKGDTDASQTIEPPSTIKTDSITPIESDASPSQISSVVNHSALIVTRDIEWGTVLLGFEQANKYTVLDEEGERVALIAEDMTGISNTVGRQLLRRRRSFTATVFSADGSQVIFKIRRPMYLINSSMFVEDGSGNVLGEIQQRWHLWKRNYDLYLDRSQFARIEGNFLAWEFELKSESGGTLALIDRNFQGFGKEIFTDAGKYVIHFGESPMEAAESVAKTLRARTNDPKLPPVTPLAKVRTGVKIIPTVSGNQLVVAKRLDLTQRMVALACAMTIDFDYFSHHSSGAGYLTPPIIMPLPGGSPGEAPVEGTAAATEAPPEASPGTASPDETLLGSSSNEISDSSSESSGGDEDTWSPDQSEILDGGEGSDLSGLFDNLKDFFGDS